MRARFAPHRALACCWQGRCGSRCFITRTRTGFILRLAPHRARASFQDSRAIAALCYLLLPHRSSTPHTTHFSRSRAAHVSFFSVFLSPHNASPHSTSVIHCTARKLLSPSHLHLHDSCRMRSPSAQRPLRSRAHACLRTSLQDPRTHGSGIDSGLPQDVTAARSSVTDTMIVPRLRSRVAHACRSSRGTDLRLVLGDTPGTIGSV